MTTNDLDDVDQGILHMLQKEARGTTIESMAEAVGVAPSTVRYRIDRMEDGGIIRGYRPQIDYGLAGYPLHVRWRCSANPDVRNALTRDGLHIDGVVKTAELLDGPENVHVDCAARDVDHLVEIRDALVETGLRVQGYLLLYNRYERPFDGFASSDT